jgi:glycosyltransferase involved in cell wall biosynthesis
MTKHKVLLIEHSLPHYHVPAWCEVARDPSIDLTVAYGRGFFTGEEGVPEGKTDAGMNIRWVVEPRIMRRVLGRPVLWHTAALETLAKNRYDVVIHQFETKMLSLWKARSVQRKRGQKFILWGIGESLRPTPLLDRVRWRLARTADAMVFYADANRNKYAAMGIDEERLFVARNLIDVNPIRAAAGKWTENGLREFGEERGLNPGPVLLSVGRLMKRKRMDLLIKVAGSLRRKFPGLVVVIIGDGEEGEALRSLAKSEGVSDRVLFPGRITSEEDISRWFLSADLVVAPGQIGHLATQAHAYGVPLVVADDRSVQGPEIEILQPDQTGAVYRYGDLDSLGEVIASLLRDGGKRDRMARECLRRTEEFCSVEVMAKGFIDAIHHVMRNSGVPA